MGLKGYAVVSALLLFAGGAQAQAIDPTIGGPGDPAHGQVLFKARCAICHQPDKGGKNGVGPALYGAYGRAATMSGNGFAYSDKLNLWIQKPASLVPGVKMVLPPVTSPQDRADIIAYLKTQSDAKDEAAADKPKAAKKKKKAES